MSALAPALSPHGVLSLKPSSEATAWAPARGTRVLRAFDRGVGHGLLCLGADEVGTSLPAALAYWREFGARYVTALAACEAELAESKGNVQEFLKSRHPAWNLVGRVHFNLAENRKDEAAPFAFLATYTTRLSAQAKAQHLPLGKALQEYAGANNREGLLSLL